MVLMATPSTSFLLASYRDNGPVVRDVPWISSVCWVSRLTKLLVRLQVLQSNVAKLMLTHYIFCVSCSARIRLHPACAKQEPIRKLSSQPLMIDFPLPQNNRSNLQHH